MVTDSDRTSNGRLCPFCPVESLEHVQNFPPDGTDINGHHRTRNGFTGLETDIKQIRTDTNRLKEVLSVTHPLARCDRNFRGIFAQTSYKKQEKKIVLFRICFYHALAIYIMFTI